MITDQRPIFIGEANPYDSNPRYALYPDPVNSAGGRLCRLVLGLSVHEYLRRFERRNLCAGKWSAPKARKAADDIAREAEGRAIVLLGAKVCAAFETDFAPFTLLNGGALSRQVILPHPSGLCRIWGQPGAYDRARALLREAGVLGEAASGKLHAWRRMIRLGIWGTYCEGCGSRRDAANADEECAESGS